MPERPRFLDDLAGVAGGAFSALSGLRDEAEATVRARVDEAIRRFDLVKREELEVVAEMASMARAGQEAAEKRLAILENRLAALAAAMPPAPGAGAEQPSSPPPPIVIASAQGDGVGPLVPPETD